MSAAEGDLGAEVRAIAERLRAISERAARPRASATSGPGSSPARPPSWSAGPATRSTARCARPTPTRADREVAALPGRPARAGRAIPRPSCGSPSGRDRRARRGDALLAARRRQADPPGALPRDRALGGHRPRRGAARRGGDRADPHLLADPRRPAGDGRRRAAPRAADLARRLRRGRRDPRRRRPLRRGDPAVQRAPVRGARTGARGARRARRRDRGRRAWSAASTATSPPAGSSMPRACASCMG